MDNKYQLIPPPRQDLEGWEAASVVSRYRALEPEPGLRDYLAVLRKYWLSIATVCLVVVTIATIASLKTRPVYEAVALVEIDKENSFFFPYQQVSAPEFYWDMKNYMRTRADILQSQTLALETIKRLGLERYPEFSRAETPTSALASTGEKEEIRASLVATFLGRLSVQPRRDSRLLEVRFASRDPVLAARVANTLVENFIEHNFRVRYESVNKASEWLTRQLHALQTKVEESQDAVVAYEKGNKIWAIDDRQTVTTQKLADLNHELTLAQANRYQKQSAYKLVRAGSLDALPEVSANPVVQGLRGQQAMLNDQYTQARLQFGPQYPKVLRLEAQLHEMNGLIEAEESRVAKRIATEYQKALGREQLVRRGLEQEKNAAHALNEKMVQHNLLKQEAESNKRLYESLQQKIKEAGIGVGLRSSNIRVVDPARAPQTPVRPRTSLNILLALLTGLLGGTGLAFLRAYCDNTVKTHKEVETVTGLPTLALIPKLNGTNGGGKRVSQMQMPRKILLKGDEKPTVEIITQQKPSAAVSEAFRSLRTALLVSTHNHPPQVILVTSCLPGEGKTTTAINLAVAFAQRGDPTLLVDGDLRNPWGIHKTLKPGANVGFGLSTYLAGEVGLEDISASHPSVENLRIIGTGPRAPNPAELLSGSRMRILLDRARPVYRFVVIDSPPLLSVADPVILSVLADGVLLITRSGAARREALERGHELLRMAHARTLGIVLNAIDFSSHYYYNYYKDYKYYQDTAGPGANGHGS